MLMLMLILPYELRHVAVRIHPGDFSGTLLIALLTVSYQSVKAALANPVEALKYE